VRKPEFAARTTHDLTHCVTCEAPFRDDDMVFRHDNYNVHANLGCCWKHFPWAKVYGPNYKSVRLGPQSAERYTPLPPPPTIQQRIVLVAKKWSKSIKKFFTSKWTVRIILDIRSNKAPD
jgi:hypothetical protein